ncbi:hypothetical protein [Citrobacter sp.]|uniref:hypothetical protein n=1 Tax=Citrobacter sp. TaxID=1896336 RepID=UPI002FCB7C87
MTNKIHTGHPDCCADCELQAAMKLGSTPVIEPSKKRTWFISYSWSSYSAGDRERKSGFGNVYHHQHLGHGIDQNDILDLEERLANYHIPKSGSPDDKVQCVILNIVEIDPT